ncbi:MAG: hypothetical protein E7634_00985 [Ruminococcaceae bacterium]|nr:hypothetical protein [Oscillospiraceae bacterium]
MPITEKDKELRGIIENNLVGMYSHRAYDAMKMLSVCEENYQYIKNIYNNARYKISVAHILCKYYLPEKAQELFALFSVSGEANIRKLAADIGKDCNIDLTDLFAEIDRKSKIMLKDPEGKLSFLAKYTEKYRVDVSDYGESAVIYNPMHMDTISVDYEIDEYTASFSLQHVHVQNPEDAEKWIDDVMSETLLPIGFYKNGRIVMGSHIKSSAVGKLSYEDLRKTFRPYDGGELCEFSDSFKIRSWSGEKNFEAQFVNTDGKVTIRVIG